MMPNIDSIKIDHSDWQLVEKKPYTKVFADDIKQLTAVLSVEYFDKPPEIAVALSDVHKIRFVYRSLANQSGAGLISADVIKVGGLECIQTIFKMLQPNRGVVYIGSLTFPFAEFSYVIKVQCIEIGFTGVREAFVMEKLLKEKTPIDESGNIKGWEQDPYEPEENFPFMPNLAESEEYDSVFPMHALSRARRTLKQVCQTVSFDQEIRQAAAFNPLA
jgi:hypothetical protein